MIKYAYIYVLKNNNAVTIKSLIHYEEKILIMEMEASSLLFNQVFGKLLCYILLSKHKNECVKFHE